MRESRDFMMLLGVSVLCSHFLGTMAPPAWLGPADAVGGPRHSSPASGRALLCPWWSCVHSSAAVPGSGSSKPGPARPEQRVGGLCADHGRLSARPVWLPLPAAGCITVCAESPGAQAVRRGRWRLGEPRRTPPWLWASLARPWVTSRSFLVMAFCEGNPSRSGLALSPAVPLASATSSLFDSSEVPCPRLLGQRDGRPVL